MADNTKYMTFKQGHKAVDRYTNKPYYKDLIYDYNHGKTHYRITYQANKVLSHEKLTDGLTGAKKRLAQLMKFDGAYLRFSGNVRLDIMRGRRVIKSRTSKGLWEEMYFGKTLNV